MRQQIGLILDAISRVIFSGKVVGIVLRNHAFSSSIDLVRMGGVCALISFIHVSFTLILSNVHVNRNSLLSY
ncbi:hypothetical protein F5B18DRAFT_597417 [Nemania serpens]|nr:hypothetical protein F5B18DRAFT_597417 [Nemania serpens]